MISKVCIIGNVDDGKSTLVGRLLMATQSVRLNEIQAVRDTGKFDLAHFTDGLKCEQEGEFTLDVAYRHLRIQNRRILLADAPGHVDKFQSALTAISQSDSVIIISDGERPLSPLVLLLAEAVQIFGVTQCLVVVTKMDRIDYREDIFRTREAEICDLFQSFGANEVKVIPVSAVEDQNIAALSQKMKWYVGNCLTSEIAGLGTAGQQKRESISSSGVLLTQDQDRKSLNLLRLDEGVLAVGDALRFFDWQASVTAKVLEIVVGTTVLDEVRGPISVWVGLDQTVSSRAAFELEPRGRASPGKPFLVRLICDGSPELLRSLAADGSLQLENSWLQKKLDMGELSFRSIDFLKDSGGNSGSKLSFLETKLHLQEEVLVGRKLSGVTLVDRHNRKVLGSGALSPVLL
ncbi:MAG: 50S ribosome-binding GTPase [Bdellovibrionales bacterium]|nr:50S ribosome-binding GTPase [Bdellovibrionales bacterium]